MKYILLLLVIFLLSNLTLAAFVAGKWISGLLFLGAYLRVTWLFLKR